jgi:hypothetical protein
MHVQVLQLGVVGGTQTGRRVPSICTVSHVRPFEMRTIIQKNRLPFNCSESVSIASGVGAVCDIVEHLRVGIEHGVHEADRSLALGKTLFINLKS